MYIDKEAIRQAAAETAIRHYARGLHIIETQENLKNLAKTRARMESLKDELGAEKYEAMKESIDYAEAELKHLLTQLQSQ